MPMNCCIMSICCCWNCCCCCCNCSCCWCITWSKSGCCCCYFLLPDEVPFPLFRHSFVPFPLDTPWHLQLFFFFVFVCPHRLLLFFFLFLVWESLSIAFILTFSALALWTFSALSLPHLSVGALSSRAIKWCISSSYSLGSAGDIPDALSSALIFFFMLVYQDVDLVPDGPVVNIKLGLAHLLRISAIFLQVSFHCGDPFLYL